MSDFEHRLFSFISSNWRGEPLRDYETIVHLIAATTTAKGLKVTCRLDRRKYPTGRTVSDEQMQRVNLKPNKFHGEWNYLIKPNRKIRDDIRWYLYLFTISKQPIIAERFGSLDDGLVSRDRRPIREKIETEAKIRKWFRVLTRLNT